MLLSKRDIRLEATNRIKRFVRKLRGEVPLARAMAILLGSINESFSSFFQKVLEADRTV